MVITRNGSIIQTDHNNNNRIDIENIKILFDTHGAYKYMKIIEIAEYIRIDIAHNIGRDRKRQSQGKYKKINKSELIKGSQIRSAYP